MRELTRRGRERQGRAAGLGRDQPAAPRPRDDEIRRPPQRDMDKLAEALSREHGKTLPDAKGDVQRGLEVAEFCIGAPHLLKGEFTEGAGPASTSIRCASRSAWSPASRRSTSRR
jgi:hypothetical protein